MASAQLKDDAVTHAVIVEQMQKQLKNLKGQRWLLDNRAGNSGKSVSHCCHLEALGHGMQVC